MDKNIKELESPSPNIQMAEKSGHGNYYYPKIFSFLNGVKS